MPPPPASPTHRRWSPIVAAEQAEEQRQAEERLRTWPMHRLVSAGAVLLGLRARRQGSLFNNPVFKCTAESKGPLPFNRFM
jgi:hypothetical protein